MQHLRKSPAFGRTLAFGQLDILSSYSCVSASPFRHSDLASLRPSYYRALFLMRAGREWGASLSLRARAAALSHRRRSSC